jgi:hypothetical protein
MDRALLSKKTKKNKEIRFQLASPLPAGNSWQKVHLAKQLLRASSPRFQL